MIAERLRYERLKRTLPLALQSCDTRSLPPAVWHGALASSHCQSGPLSLIPRLLVKSTGGFSLLHAKAGPRLGLAAVGILRQGQVARTAAGVSERRHQLDHLDIAPSSDQKSQAPPKKEGGVEYCVPHGVFVSGQLELRAPCMLLLTTMFFQRLCSCIHHAVFWGLSV